MIRQLKQLEDKLSKTFGDFYDALHKDWLLRWAISSALAIILVVFAAISLMGLVATVSIIAITVGISELLK